MQHSIYSPKKTYSQEEFNTTSKNIEESLFIEYTISFLHIPKTKQNKNKTKETQIVSLALQNSNKIKPKKHRPFLLALPFLFAKKR